MRASGRQGRGNGGQTYSFSALKGRGKRRASSSWQQAVRTARVIGKHGYKRVRGGQGLHGGSRGVQCQDSQDGGPVPEKLVCEDLHSFASLIYVSKSREQRDRGQEIWGSGDLGIYYSRYCKVLTEEDGGWRMEDEG
jgi:hypothetical protein